MIEQDGYVSRPFPQRRQNDRDHVEPVIKILSEAARPDRLFQVLIGGGNQPEINFLGGPAADALDDMLLQNPQQLALQTQSERANLVEKQGSTLRRFDVTGAGFMCVGKSALLMAKQFGLDQAFRKSGAVYADERLVPPGAAGDDGLSYQFFSGPALAANQHVDVALGHTADSVVNQSHRITATNQLAK